MMGKIVIGDICTERFPELIEELGSDNAVCMRCDVSVKEDVDALCTTLAQGLKFLFTDKLKVKN